MDKLTNKNNVTLSLAVWLGTDTYDHDPDPKIISATSLLKPIRAIVLARQNKDLIKIGDVTGLIPSRMGTAYHDSIESSWNGPQFREVLLKLGYSEAIIDRVRINPKPEEVTGNIIPVYMELRGKKACGDFIISGKFDFCAEGNLEDFKSTSVWSYIFGSNNSDYIYQGSIYRWLHPEIITGDKITIQYIFTDWSASKAKQDRAYPQSRILSKTFPLMSIAETDAFIKGRLKAISSLLGAPQEQLPLCTPDELWQKEAVWKYYKDPDKRVRSTKNFTNPTEAHTRCATDGGTGIVVEVPGEVVRCRYCDVVGICSQAENLVNQKLLNLE